MLITNFLPSTTVKNVLLTKNKSHKIHQDENKVKIFNPINNIIIYYSKYTHTLQRYIMYLLNIKY